MRVWARPSPLFDVQGKRFEQVPWLTGRCAPVGRICRTPGCFHLAAGRQRVVRLRAARLSEQQQAAHKRQRKKASQRGKPRKHQADTRDLAGWLLVVTTRPAEPWSEQEGLSLSQRRWHIERFFKRCKQLLDIPEILFDSRRLAEKKERAVISKKEQTRGNEATSACR